MSYDPDARVYRDSDGEPICGGTNTDHLQEERGNYLHLIVENWFF